MNESLMSLKKGELISNLSRLLRVSDKKNSKNKTKKLSLIFPLIDGFLFIIKPTQNKIKPIEDILRGTKGNGRLKGKESNSNLLIKFFIKLVAKVSKNNSSEILNN